MQAMTYAFQPIPTKAPFFWAIILAFALHLLLVALLAVHFFYAVKAPSGGANVASPIHSYLHIAAPRHNAISKSTVQVPLSKAVAIVKEDAPLAASAASSAEKTAAVAAKPVALGGVAPDALSQLLHQAIQAQQSYPDSALALERSGVVTVAFMLSPAGSISDLRCVKSSGTVSLDDAALEAVQKAAPFQGVQAYLTETKRFQLALRFELPG